LAETGKYLVKSAGYSRSKKAVKGIFVPRLKRSFLSKLYGKNL